MGLSKLWSPDGAPPSSFKILLGVSFSTTLFKFYLEWRNYRAVKKQTKVSPCLKNNITQEDFEKGKRYHLDLQRFGLLNSAFFNLVSFGMELGKIEGLLFGKSAVWLASLLNRVGPALPSALSFLPVTPLEVMGSFRHAVFLSVLQDIFMTILRLPFGYYQNFVVEEKHGFNRMTRMLFFKDLIKSILLRVLLYYPLMCGLIQGVVKVFGEQFPLFLSFGFVVFSLVFMYAIPKWIVPLFYKVTPMDPQDSLFKLIHAHCEACGFHTDNLGVVDGSTRSTHSNAMLMGLGKGKRIWLFDTILNDLTQEEVAGVVRHELGHWFHSHVKKLFFISMLQLTAITFASREIMYHPSLAREFGFPEAAISSVDSSGNTPRRFSFSPFIGFHICELFFDPLIFLLSTPQNIFSRHCEFQADAYSVTGAGPMPEKEEGEERGRTRGEVISSALMKIHKKENVVEHDWLYELMECSHPSLTDRIRGIQEVERKMLKKKN